MPFRSVYFLFALLLSLISCEGECSVRCGAERLDIYLPQLEGKTVGLVVNQSSRVGEGHLLDTLLSLGVKVDRIFTPEHGFRGDADAGEHVGDGRDSKSGLPIISLYGSNRRATKEQLKGLDLIVFDLQDVGARFYTYISTLYYLMQECAKYNVAVMVLDRPNPNDYVDGPIITESLRSFVGALPIPILHGLTVGELAMMINGEGWVGDEKVRLDVIPIKGWRHGDHYSLPIKPSPNLPNDQAIALYPSLCLFEATEVSVGRGTLMPFQVIGYPDPQYGSFSFTPMPLEGFDKNPLQGGKVCYGIDLRKVEAPKGFSLRYFIDFMKISGSGADFISRVSMFDRLVGSVEVREMITDGHNEESIRASWQDELSEYRKMRRNYLLYK